MPSDDRYDSDDDRSVSDTSDDVVELSADEIPDYFQERGGRLFHSHGGCPYPLPVDGEEQHRQDGLNQLLRRLIGDSAVGPVRDILAHAPGDQRRVLDLGTGTGTWVLDMAHDFPNVKFYGVDIVPIATRYPPRNVQFEMHDIKERFRYDAGSMDLIHARSITMAIRDYGALLPEIARMLRRGGLFVSCEWGRFPAMADGSDVSARAPHAVAFFDAVQDTLRERRGIPHVAPEIPRLLEDSGYFTQIVPRRYHMPIGDWHSDPLLRELGREYRDMVNVYARSMRGLLLEGPWAAHTDTLVRNFLDETWSVRGMVSTLFTVHARRG
ncbi:S-adenosyl-L-methionine-dependent methyltransferase [Daedaleopsis nitida]|nr:S-adenosyl-L-methionine-dependent methyltransferase [Daedaleopsis nitida]